MSIKINELSPLYMYNYGDDDTTPTPSSGSGPSPSPVAREVYTMTVGYEKDPMAAVTYSDDALGKRPIMVSANYTDMGDWENAFFMPKPCMLNYDGTVAYYLNPNDYSKKADGSASDVANADFEGNAMMEWPLIWYRFRSEGGSGQWSLSVSNEQVDSDYECWCNHDCNGNISQHFYTAIYNATGTSKFRSLSGVTCNATNGCGNTTSTQERTRATANNTTDNNEWYTNTFAMFELIYALLIMVGKCTAVQYVFGYGLAGSGIDDYVSGTANDKGLFYGDQAYNNKPVKVFGMENWYGYKWDRLGGLYSYQSKFWAKKTWNTEDGTSVVGFYTGSCYNEFLDVTPNSGRPSNNQGFLWMNIGSEHGVMPRFNNAYTTYIDTYYAQRHDYYGSFFEMSDGYHEGMVGSCYQNGMGTTQDTYVGVSWNFGLAGLSTNYVSTRLTCIPVATT